MEQKLVLKDTFIIEFRKKVGEMVKQSREKLGYSQDDLADLMNINRVTISKIENGKFAFNIDFLAKLSNCLHFDIQFSNL